MTRRNDKRNNRHNRQRNNNSEVSPFAQMLIGAILSKGAVMIANALKDKAGETTEDKPHTGIRQSDNILESSCIINGDGSATEITIPDGFQIFISEDGKPMIRKKIEGDEEKEAPDAAEGKPITYDDILKELYFDKTAYWVSCTNISSTTVGETNYNDINNCTTSAQAKRIIAFNKLLNIAKYLNSGWKPCFDGNNLNWNICKESDTFTAMYTRVIDKANVYFKSEDLTNEAIRLMGKESLDDLFSTDW